jgi:restriction endonuclease S subunit
MSSYTLSPTLNKSRVFILQKSEMENSLSPLYYSALPKKISHGKRLKEIAFVNPSRPRPKFESEELVPYVGLPETDEHTKAIVQVALRPYKEIAGRNIIYPNELLFARIEPSVFNKKYILTEDLKGHPFAFTSTEFYVVKGREVSNKFLMAAFHSNYVFSQVAGKTTGSTGRRRLDNDVFENLIIPVPDKQEQDKIIKIYDNAFDLRRKNEAEAENLLSSIDDYLINEFGIVLPQLPENTLGNRIFTSTITTISGDRFDPYHHQVRFIKTIAAIRKSKYQVTAFKNLITDLKNGVEIRNYVEDGGVRYLRVTDLGKNGLNNNSPRFVLEQDVPDKIKLNSNCILISRSGSLGLINVVEPEIENCILSSHIFKVELKTEAINPIYLEAYLRSQLGQSEIFRNNNGGVIPEINQDALKSILIVVPPIEKQKEIAENITSIRQQAQRLKDKTKEALANASKEIEIILVGNA